MAANKMKPSEFKSRLAHQENDRFRPVVFFRRRMTARKEGV
jgi:hypothetical protein